MSRTHVLSLCCVAGLALSGCGPMQVPLPARLDEKQQQAVNEGWDKALTPVGRHDQQALLDILMTTSTYQYGVDKLSFRSEKRFSGGLVVMEVQFDRTAPNDDLFTVTVLDNKGATLRKERYAREQIERTYKELFTDEGMLRYKKEHGGLTPEEGKKLAAIEARLAVVSAAFPKPPEENKGPPPLAGEAAPKGGAPAPKK